MKVGERIRITGTVQGVGFRPTVWRLAKECRITGRVWNDAEGVLIHAWGAQDALEQLVTRLRAESPPLSRIEAIVRSALQDLPPAPRDFRIVDSREGQARTGIAVDAATCSQCVAEIHDPADRRYRYPFTNCTHCGPRLSIVTSIPYDRSNTSMAAFPMCPQCKAEYHDPGNRRFHAQPNACPVCGPRAWLEDAHGQVLSHDGDADAMAAAARLIRAGHIVAIKGLGGFHLACDAGHRDAVDALRCRKRRYRKAFALLARDLDMIRRFAAVTDVEAALLNDAAAPIVILAAAGATLAPGVAPGQHTLGFMLPYTPLHHLLMQDMPGPVVLTSGNQSDEPQAIDNADAHERLNSIADYFLLHDRDIVNRLDDSVVRVADHAPRFLRRARGYAPQPVLLASGFADAAAVLAMGGELKNTFCLLRDGRAIVSQHIGDLEEALTLKDYRRNLALYGDLFAHRPALVAVDLHPDYLSTQRGRDLARTRGVPLIAVQHHHAHIAACLAEHGRDPDAEPVLGVALDGLGFGTDNSLWGGEFMIADYRSFRRVARFQPVPMVGGTRAVYEPWRNTWAHLSCALGWEWVQQEFSHLEIIRLIETKPLAILQRMAAGNLNSPPASSCGRLFDAVAAAIGVCCDRVSYEGQAAVELESLACTDTGRDPSPGYGYRVAAERDAGLKTLQWAPLWRTLLADLDAGVRPESMAARFHRGLINAVAELACRLCSDHRLQTAVLSGGVFQNRLLLNGVSERLRAAGIEVLAPVRTPANDGGLALGQATVAAARSLSPHA